MARNVEIFVDEFYHIFNHGNGDRLIFLDDSDKKRFIALLYLANCNEPINFEDIEKGQEFDFDRGETLVSLGAYCLMDNHYHLLVKEKIDGGISKFMQKFSTAYTMYYNKKHFKRGSLFEGRFRVKHLDGDAYLKYIFAYIHLNPVKMIQSKWKEIGLTNRDDVVAFLNKYRFSSYLDYVSEERLENKILDPSQFPEYFKNKEEFVEEMDDWLNFHKEESELL